VNRSNLTLVRREGLQSLFSRSPRVICTPLFSRAIPNNNFQSGARSPYSRILVLPLKMRCFQGFRQLLTGLFPENALLSLYLQLNAVMMTLHYSRAAARCNNRSLVASALWRPCHRFSKHSSRCVRLLYTYAGEERV
jgi:hypothetical protein